ncbi:helix-turn-helix domain-containing protein [Nonomuraea jabiensis]|uniref:Transcriptional regulator with XRE-family HTH domain n=1 Tax=Nonomuraea jabiensis TaxID=882448 RepID=A0A7W9L989_9ACTN|nr:helix-turn-helix transcriptional regulator [Nonomuraea jabiensis]MBB5775332.1 transcriptional regulator with XRE-family HTH domain [Nonomuraea jabiensis]
MLGERLQSVRKRRGLSQRELAARSGVALSLVRKVEQGERNSVRVETLRKWAEALGVTTTTLLEADGASQPESSHPDDLAPLREALQTGATDLEDVPTADGLRSAVAGAVRLYHDGQYAELTAVLPVLVKEAQTLVEQGGPDALAIRARVLQLVGSLATQTRVFDVAEIALEGAVTDAIETGDRIEAASAVITLCWLLLRERRLDEARVRAVDWADEIEPRMSRASNMELSAWGWLLLRGSAAAIRDNRPDEADEMMRLALSGAVRLGREHGSYHEYFTTFGPATVQMKRVENAIIESQPERALQLAREVSPGLRPTSDNRNRHLLDVANARVMLREYDKALDIMTQLTREAPEWLPNQHYAKDLLTTIIGRRRTLTAEMRALADAIGLEP